MLEVEQRKFNINRCKQFKISTRENATQSVWYYNQFHYEVEIFKHAKKKQR